MKDKVKNTYIFSIVLILVEQIIKIIINNNFFNYKLGIFEPYLYFDPMFNRDYSWFNSMFQLGVGKYAHIILVLLILFIIVFFYSYINERYGSNSLVNIMYAFLFAGAVCSLIDKVFWNGSLDYIKLNGYFTFDLKDVYINIFNVLLVYSVIFKRDIIEKLDDDLMTGFKNYILSRKNN